MLWPIRLQGGSVTITAKCTAGCTGTQQLESVTFGDVWYCAGQSNMALPFQFSYARSMPPQRQQTDPCRADVPTRGTQPTNYRRTCTPVHPVSHRTLCSPPLSHRDSLFEAHCVFSSSLFHCGVRSFMIHLRTHNCGRRVDRCNQERVVCRRSPAHGAAGQHERRPGMDHVAGFGRRHQQRHHAAIRRHRARSLLFHVLL